MKKIVIFYDYFEPAKKAGGVVRSIRNLIDLLATDFEFYVFTSAYDLGAKKKLEDIVCDSWVAHDSHLHIYYSSTSFGLLKGMNREVSKLKPDIIYVNGIFSLAFSVFPLIVAKRQENHPLVIIAPRGMVQKGALVVKAIKKKIYIRIIQFLKLYKNVRWHATEQQELNDIHKVFDIPTGTISVTLAVDTPSIKFAEVNFLPKLKNQLQLIYLSLITEKKNLLDLFSALKVIPPHIRIKLNVYGPIKDKNYWDKCLSTSLSLPSHIVFSYGGIVDPKDTLEIIQQHHFFILPTRGENFGHAIYESFLASRPVIISDCTPWKALEEREAGFVFFIGQPTLSTYIERAAEMDEATYVRYCHGAQKVAKDYLASNNFREQYLNLFQA